MIKICFRILIVLQASIIVSCATPDAVHLNELQAGKSDIKTLTYDSNLRSIFIVGKNSKNKICSEPAPDSGESLQSGISAEGGAQGKAEEGVSAEQGSSSSSLGGRSSTVLLARELLFRACELGANYDTSYEQQASIFIRTLESIEKIADEGQAKGPITKALNSQAMWKDAPKAEVPDRIPSSKNPSSDDSSSGDSTGDSSSDDSE